jgi:hypothetical protein
LRVCWESAVNNHHFAFFDLVFQAASKRRDVKLASGEWAIDEDDVRAKDDKDNQVLDCRPILLLRKKYPLSFGRLLCLGSQMTQSVPSMVRNDENLVTVNAKPFWSSNLSFSFSSDLHNPVPEIPSTPSTCIAFANFDSSAKNHSVAGIIQFQLSVSFAPSMLINSKVFHCYASTAQDAP